VSIFLFLKLLFHICISLLFNIKVDEELSEAAAIFELLHEVQPAAVETVPVNSAAESEEIVQPPKDQALLVGGIAAVGQAAAVIDLGM
jgi:hypothetical protein